MEAISLFFRKSKLLNCTRINSKLKKSYYPAQTPFQRLRSAQCLEEKTLKDLDSINHALDPVRLLKQIKILQDALWQHVVLTKQLNHDSGTREIYDRTFQVPITNFTQKVTTDHNNDTLILNGIEKRSQYRKSKKPKVKHWWRTRNDPFENVWDDVCCKWLEKNPERTATSILSELQQKYPGEYTKSQLRTLQRRVQAWRKKVIISYDDELLKNDSIGMLKAVTLSATESE